MNKHTYCTYCHKDLRERRSSKKAVTQNTYDGKLTFCNWTCAYNYNRRQNDAKRRLAHLTKNQRSELVKRLGYKSIINVNVLLHRSNVDGPKFTDIILCDDPRKRRDEFYKLFDYENDADILWIRLMHWFYDYTEEEIEADIPEVLEAVRNLNGYNSVA